MEMVEEMMELREKIALALVNHARGVAGWQGELPEVPDVPESENYRLAADRILAIPEIKEALELRAIAECGKISGIEFK